MKRHFESLRVSDLGALSSVPDGLFLVRVERALYRHANKPFYQLCLAILEPRHLAGCLIISRLYCTAKTMWKMNWFLREFGYDSELLNKNEIDDKALAGLHGIVKISHVAVHGLSLINLDGFAPAERWKELSPASITDHVPGSEVA
jgi:hypothetical protein